jgi:hypothetical protein
MTNYNYIDKIFVHSRGFKNSFPFSYNIPQSVPKNTCGI